VARGLSATRARAADAIRRGTVLVGGERITKPGQRVPADAEIRMEDPAAGYVSRAALKLLAALVKPQFEAGPEHVGKGGVVRDEEVHRRVLERIRAWLESEGWEVAGIIPSPVTGGDGNREFLLAASRRAETATV